MGNCTTEVEGLSAILAKFSSGDIGRSITWALHGRHDVERLRSCLEAHKSSFEIALDALQM